MSGPLCAARAAAAACLVTSLIAHPQDLGHGDRDVATGFQHRGFAAPTGSLVPALAAPGHLHDAMNIYSECTAEQPLALDGLIVWKGCGRRQSWLAGARFNCTPGAFLAS